VDILKRRSVPATTTTTVAPQRVPLVSRPVSSQSVQSIPSRPSSIRVTQSVPQVVNLAPPVAEDEDEQSMDIEEVVHEDPRELINAIREVETMIEDQYRHYDDRAEYIWPEAAPERLEQYRRKVQAVRDVFVDEPDMHDTTMVSEYSEEIFQYMSELEETLMPNPEYMDGQNDLTWEMRQTLVDWLLQVHLRYHMLPETMWIAINIIDRFLTKRVVSIAKLQLVGITAIFIAAKYEEILAPGVDEFVFLTQKAYSREEILKGERIILQTLDFKISQYCSPYSWMRKISKADDYDIQTRTLSKFLTEVTLLDHRFLRAKPSLIAAVGMYTARRMLGGDWNDAFVFYSGFTEEQMIPGHRMLIEKLTESGFDKLYVSRKYSNKKFLKAANFALEWARNHCDEDFQMLC